MLYGNIFRNTRKKGKKESAAGRYALRCSLIFGCSCAKLAMKTGYGFFGAADKPPCCPISGQSAGLVYAFCFFRRSVHSTHSGPAMQMVLYTPEIMPITSGNANVKMASKP